MVGRRVIIAILLAVIPLSQPNLALLLACLPRPSRTAAPVSATPV